MTSPFLNKKAAKFYVSTEDKDPKNSNTIYPCTYAIRSIRLWAPYYHLENSLWRAIKDHEMTRLAVSNIVLPQVNSFNLKLIDFCQIN